MISQKSLKSTVTRAENMTAAVVVCRNLISLCGALSHLPARALAVTQSPDYRMLSLSHPFSSHAASEGARRGGARPAALCSAQTQRQRKRRCSFTQKSPNVHM